MNRLQFFTNEGEAENRGFRNILATEPGHPYSGKWWPPGHITGYEHTFVNAAADFLAAVAGGGRIEPNFEDGVRIMRVLEAGVHSAEEGRKYQPLGGVKG